MTTQPNPKDHINTNKITMTSGTISTASYIRNMYPSYATFASDTFTYPQNSDFTCCICHKRQSTASNMDALFIKGYWFCMDECRWEHLWRLLRVTETL